MFVKQKKRFKLLNRFMWTVRDLASIRLVFRLGDLATASRPHLTSNRRGIAPAFKSKAIQTIESLYVDRKGFEPLASSMPWKRSSQLS